MSEQYAGNPAVFPADYPIPDDSEPPTGAAVAPALEALGDRTANLKKGKLAIGTTVTITASNPTYPTPVGATMCRARLLGGGGGGGGGAHGIGTTNLFSSGGGGGGGAIYVDVEFRVDPAGENLALVVGGGGLGAAAELDGTSGGTTSITKVTGSVLVGSALGGGGGSRGTRTASGQPLAYAYGVGGPSPRPDPSGEAPLIVPENGGAGQPGVAGLHLTPAAHHGAYGRTFNDRFANARGGSAPEGYRGGANGVNANVAASLYQPGGVGGGGGASSEFPGQNGGNGGSANAAGTGGAGTGGNHGSGFNDGRGGGGGGGGGGGSAGGGAGAFGGDGAGGKIYLTFYGDV